MELYVIVGYDDYGYEGFSEPATLGVYTTLEIAQRCQKEYMQTKNHYTNTFIEKVILNKSIDC